MCERRKCMSNFNTDEQPIVKIERVDKDLKFPEYAKEYDSGFDVMSTIDYILKPGESKLIDSGIKMQLAFGYEAQVRSRSGIALKNCSCVLNSPGTIDYQYNKNVGIILINHSTTEEFRIKRGDRIAQIVIAPVAYAKLVEVDKIEDSGRGGWGHTGV